MTIDSLFFKIMKLSPYKFIAFFIVITMTMDVYAGKGPGNGPPAPTGKGALLPPGPRGLPIDENVFILLSVAIFFGIYIIYKNSLKAKTSI
jgi:hypothetical protein